MPKKLCAYGGCHEIISGAEKYCEEHKKLYEQLKSEHNQRYDKNIRHKRDKRYTEFYHSKEWETLRDFVIRTYKGLDLFAYFIENRIVPADTAHHITELKEDWDLRLAIDNIIPVSDASHKKIHTLYRQDKEGTQKLLKGLLKKAEIFRGDRG